MLYTGNNMSMYSNNTLYTGNNMSMYSNNTLYTGNNVHVNVLKQHALHR